MSFRIGKNIISDTVTTSGLILNGQFFNADDISGSEGPQGPEGPQGADGPQGPTGSGGGGGSLNDLSDCFTTASSVVVGTGTDITGTDIIALGKNIIPTASSQQESVLIGYDIGPDANASSSSVVVGEISVVDGGGPGHNINRSTIIGINMSSPGFITQDVVCIGYNNIIRDTNQILIGTGIDATAGGNTFYISPGGMRATGATTAMYYNDSTGEITQLTSSRRHKTNIQDADIDSSKLHELIPKTYTRIGTEETEVGYIAEEVAELFPQFVTKDSENLPYSINYELLVIPLIEEVKKLRKELDELKNH